MISLVISRLRSPETERDSFEKPLSQNVIWGSLLFGLSAGFGSVFWCFFWYVFGRGCSLMMLQILCTHASIIMQTRWDLSPSLNPLLPPVSCGTQLHPQYRIEVRSLGRDLWPYLCICICTAHLFMLTNLKNARHSIICLGVWRLLCFFCLCGLCLVLLFSVWGSAHRFIAPKSIWKSIIDARVLRAWRW